MQVAHFLRRNPDTTLSLPHHIARYYNLAHAKSKGITLIYNTLNQKDTFTKPTHITLRARLLHHNRPQRL